MNATPNFSVQFFQSPATEVDVLELFNGDRLRGSYHGVVNHFIWFSTAQGLLIINVILVRGVTLAEVTRTTPVPFALLSGVAKHHAR